MRRTIRTCVYSTDEQAGHQIVEALGQTGEVEVVAEVLCADSLKQAVQADAPEMILINLDPDLEKSLQLVHDVAASVANTGIIGVSERKDPETIIQAMRSGCTQFVCAPIEVADLREAVSRTSMNHRTVEDDSSRCICVLGSGGGVGATTLACTLAVELAAIAKRPTALVDLDLDFGDVAASFDATPTYTLSDICEPKKDLDDEVVRSAMTTLPCNVELLARPNRLGDAHSVCPEGVGSVLDVLRKEYPNVVLDLPRSFTAINAAAIQRASLVLIVAQLRVAAMRNAHRVFELLLQMGADEDRVELVLNRSNAAHERFSVQNVESTIGHTVFAQIPNDYRNVAEAQDLGHPIASKAPRSPARNAIREMAAKICQADKKGDRPTQGILKRLWGKKPVVS